MARLTNEVRGYVEQLISEMERMELLVLKRPAPSPFGNGGVWCTFMALDDDLNAYKCHALVFAEPSKHGIDEGRVSKLTVIDDFDDKQVFHFDRGHTEGEAPKGLLAAVATTFPHQVTTR